MTSEQIVALTPLWEGDRSDDGRPYVAQRDLDALREATPEHAWAVLDPRGYKFQYDAGWNQTNPGHNLVGRALTCAFLPFRPDFNEAVVREGRSAGFTAAERQNTWVVESLSEGDCLVVDIFGKVNGGTVLGDNLGTAVAVRTGVGAVVDGGVRDLSGLEELSGNFYYRETDPSPILEVQLASVNAPVAIGAAVVLPGDVVLGTRRGVTFIPAHLAAAIADECRRTTHRDLFGKSRIADRVYTTTEIDVTDWPEHIEADYQRWSLENPI